MQQAAALRTQLDRQVSHWQAAVLALDEPEDFASAAAWTALEHYLHRAVRAELDRTALRLQTEITGLRRQLDGSQTIDELLAVRTRLLRFRRAFLQAETVFDFYGDAVNTRTSPRLAAVLRALDHIAERSMEAVLGPLGRPIPPVLTYVDKGLGASILRAGIRLWDPDSISPAAAVKITRQNLYRPTALIHETGHQVAHLLGWNDELAGHFRRDLDGEVRQAWVSWTSEVSADAFAFAHCGYAAVASLHDVVANDPASVTRFGPGDPHPVAWIRVLLGVAMCRRFFGAGPWDALADGWVSANPVEAADPFTRRLLVDSVPVLPRIVDACLARPMQAFGGRPLAAVVDPARVRPDELARLAVAGGASLYTSAHWVTNEPLRIMAWTGYRIATDPADARTYARRFEVFARNLGGLSTPLPTELTSTITTAA